MTKRDLMLFAAGLGTRMAPLTNHRPKPLIEVGGRALLDHALDVSRTPLVGRRVINVRYKAQMIRDHLRGQDIAISQETEAIDTGGGLRQALPLLGTDPVFTLNTDAIWSGPNPVEALSPDWQDEDEALLLLVPTDRALGHPAGGDFSMDGDGHLTRGPDLIYTGLQLMRTGRLHQIDAPAFSLNRIWDLAEADQRLRGAVYPGWWCDVGRPDCIPLAEGLLEGVVDV